MVLASRRVDAALLSPRMGADFDVRRVKNGKKERQTDDEDYEDDGGNEDDDMRRAGGRWGR